MSIRHQNEEKLFFDNNSSHNIFQHCTVHSNKREREREERAKRRKSERMRETKIRESLTFRGKGTKKQWGRGCFQERWCWRRRKKKKRVETYGVRPSKYRSAVPYILIKRTQGVWFTFFTLFFFFSHLFL